MGFYLVFRSYPNTLSHWIMTQNTVFNLEDFKNDYIISY